MNLLSEIRTKFAYLQLGNFYFIQIPSASPSWILKNESGNGVAIEVDSTIEINEKFASVSFYTKDYEVNGETKRLLILLSSANHLRNEFAHFCTMFLEKGPQDVTRNQILKDPLRWWKSIKELIGNANQNREAYSVLGEMLGYYHLIKNDSSTNWAGPLDGIVDITTNTALFEVKSTTSRYDSTIQINSQYQLSSDKKGYLMFFRFEQSSTGICINEVAELLIQHGVNDYELEKRLSYLGIEKGSSLRKQKYRLIESLLYKVDSDFPKISAESFKNNQIPLHVTKITYHIDLKGLNSTFLNIL